MAATAIRSLTIPCPVHLDLSDGQEIDAVLHLPADPLRPGGTASVESVLDGSKHFIPVGTDAGDALLARGAIRALEMPAAGPGVPDSSDVGGSFDIVTLRLDSGREISGVLRTFAPLETMRMSDFFNLQDRYIVLGAGDRVFLVSKKHVVLVSF